MCQQGSISHLMAVSPSLHSAKADSLEKVVLFLVLWEPFFRTQSPVLNLALKLTSQVLKYKDASVHFCMKSVAQRLLS